MEPESSTALSEFSPTFLTQEESFDDHITDNGLCLNNVYVPEEIVLHILSFIDPKELLNESLVCHRWNSLIKSYALWSEIYKRKYHRKPKLLPWYLYYCLLSTNYFDNNLVKNGNGQDKFNNWVFKANEGQKCIIEDPPVGADPLPLEQPEFNNLTSCFATSYYGTCCKMQQIKFGKSKLFQYILDNYQPHMYLSEWMAGRFDCCCIYKLKCVFTTREGVKLPDKKNFSYPHAIKHVEQWQGSKWEKVEITVKEYPEGLAGVNFQHEGRGHYGSKIAGGVFKLLFDSIEPLVVNEEGKKIPRKFTKVKFDSNGNNEGELIGNLDMWCVDTDYEDDDDDDISMLERYAEDNGIEDDYYDPCDPCDWDRW